MKHIYICIVMLGLSGVAQAVEQPKLPVDAKKLKTSEIESIYNDKTLSGEYYGWKTLVTWTSTNDATKKTVTGTWSGADGSKGETHFTYTIKKDKWCVAAKGKPAHCVDVFADSAYVYEVEKGKVQTRFEPPK